MPYYKNHIIKQISFTIEKIKNNIYKPVKELNIELWITEEPVSFEDRTSGEHKILKSGDKWGKLWDCAWTNLVGEVPSDCKGKKVVLLVDFNGEGCVFDENGTPVRGLTNISSDFDFGLDIPGKRVLQFLECAEGEEQVDLWVELGMNDLFGKYKEGGQIKEVAIATLNEEMRQLYYDAFVLYDLMQNISDKSARYASILNALEDMKNVMCNYSDDEVKIAREILKVELDKTGGMPSLTACAVGHAHLDLAWLWPIRETKRKGGRTFATALELMDRYPDYIFGASQPQLYQWIKEDYPELYEKIKVKIAEGRWEVQGGMWVESDTNIAGGEALIRQIVYGKKFFNDEFNKDMKVLWLPDVFGYSGALPQILKKAEIDYFMTIKLSWSEHNVFPHHTFDWEGIDGTKILSHMPPTGTYNHPVTPEYIKMTEEDFRDKGVSDECLILFGIGDGGGGPGTEHLERLDRIKDLQGLIPVKQGHSIDFFKRIENGKNRDKLKTWVGELYLERHQGTYTTQSKIKWYNRKLENLMREWEFAESLCKTLLGDMYDEKTLEQTWKEILLYQFHDILPGSSIKRVYDEAEARYEVLYKLANDKVNEKYAKIANALNANSDNDYTVFNSLSWDREEWININGKEIKVAVPAMGYTTVNIAEVTEEQYELAACENKLENEFLKILFGENGEIISVFDRENNKEVIRDGVANQMTLYYDWHDAWDINIDYRDRRKEIMKLISRDFEISNSAVIITQVFEYEDSTLSQKIILKEGSRKIVFETNVDWNTREMMLRTSFPVNVRSDVATCNIQFGNIKRPTHVNTSWDMAKFEICAQKWIDISQDDYGVALINDCKYGHNVHNNILDIDLLRSTNYPGENADQGNHTFSYELYPHSNNEVSAKVAKVGYEFNTPLVVSKTGSGNKLDNSLSFISVLNENVIIETVKESEDKDGIIVRLYEAYGTNQTALINIPPGCKEAYCVNLMEHIEGELIIDNNSVNLDFTPFEIKTIKLK